MRVVARCEHCEFVLVLLVDAVMVMTEGRNDGLFSGGDGSVECGECDGYGRCGGGSGGGGGGGVDTNVNTDKQQRVQWTTERRLVRVMLTCILVTETQRHMEEWCSPMAPMAKAPPQSSRMRHGLRGQGVKSNGEKG
jgi:hypothetical protein